MWVREKDVDWKLRSHERLKANSEAGCGTRPRDSECVIKPGTQQHGRHTSRNPDVLVPSQIIEGIFLVFGAQDCWEPQERQGHAILKKA